MYGCYLIKKKKISCINCFCTFSFHIICGKYSLFLTTQNGHQGALKNCIKNVHELNSTMIIPSVTISYLAFLHDLLLVEIKMIIYLLFSKLMKSFIL